MKTGPAGFWKTAGVGYIATARLSAVSTHRCFTGKPTNTVRLTGASSPGLDKHGQYRVYLSEEESISIARETKEYENAFLTQEIQFLEYMQDYFARHRLRHVQKVYDDRMRGFLKGDVISIMVYYDSRLEKHSLRRQ